MSANSFRNAPAFSGLIPPLITPLTEDREVDVAGLERLIEHLLAGGVTGVFALGTSGEGPLLTNTEARRLVTETRRLVDGRAPVLVGALEPGTQRALEAVALAEEWGADAVVVTTPYYYAADARTQIAHFATIALSTELPVILYNIPSMTHNPLSAESVAELLEVENILGIKDSAGDWEGFSSLLALRATRPGFSVMQGAEKLAMQSILAGADGLVPGLGNLVPELFRDLLLHIRNGELDAADDTQQRVNQLWALHTCGYWLVCLKYAASLLGFGSGATSGHCDTLAPEAKSMIRSLLERYRG